MTETETETRAVERTVAIPALQPVSIEDFASVKTGAPRSEVLTLLGQPYAKIVIPEDSSTREIFRYRNGSVMVGTIELIDGKVEAIKQAER